MPCQYCGRPMRPTVQLRFDDGKPNGMDAYRCVDFCTGIYPTESLAVQRSMVADMFKLGWGHRGFTDPTTGHALTLGDVFDRHAIALIVVEELDHTGEAQER